MPETADRWWLTKADIADLTQLTEPQIDGLRKRWGFPHERGKQKNKKDLRFYAPDWLARWRAELSNADPTTDHRERLARIKADQAELDLALSRGELIPAQQWNEDVQFIGQRIRAAVENLGGFGVDVQSVMLDVLKEMAEKFELESVNGITRHKRNGKAKG